MRSSRVLHCLARHLVPLCFGFIFDASFAAPAEPLSWEQGNGFRFARLLSAGHGQSGFTAMSSLQTSVVFSNRLEDRTVLKNHNLMLGSGVAAGDFDGDGWCDLYFCAIDGSNALFRNRGGWRFEDVTTVAGAALPGNTSTGAVFADVDGDGDLDLLVSSLGHGVKLLRNDGGGRFNDTTGADGLSSTAGSMTMALGDIDGDGDLDLFVCNYGAQALAKSGVNFQVKIVNGQPEIQGPLARRLRIVNGKLVELGEPPVLFLNDGRGRFYAAEWDGDRFRDEEGQAMQPPWDFGLSAQMRDVNGDGAPDIYVCNDFDTPDRFWLNDGRGRFRLLPRLAQRCESHASMGVDFADVDRDGRLDLFVAEMLAADRARRLWQLNPQTFAARVPGLWGNRGEVSRNTLFHARDDGTFAEIGNYAGIAASDWSWQGSFLDVDLDGFEDLLVVNGHLFDVQDLDVPPARSRSPADLQAELLASPRLFTPNRAWRNRGDLTFEDRSAAWSFHDTNICHGMALADLDNDGDLDVVVNRMNATASLLRNDAAAPRVAVRLRGVVPNTLGIGAKITLWNGWVPAQTGEIICGGKYLSGDQGQRVFASSNGDGNKMAIEVAWRSGGRTVISNVAPNRLYEIVEAERLIPSTPVAPGKAPEPLFSDVSDRLNHVHREPDFNDFQLQPLLTRKLSQRGPGLCITDLDGDSHDDLVVGAGRGGSVLFFRGDGRGGFKRAAASAPVPDDVLALVEWSPDSAHRGVLCTLANYENKVSETPLLLLALEKGELAFHTVADPSRLPAARAVGYGLAVADYDSDGDLDVFMGGHAISGRYPEAAPSLLLRNDGGVLNPDAANSAILRDVGLVNSMVWTDLDNDGWSELVLACEWGPIRVFRNVRGRLAAWDAPAFFRHSPASTLSQWTGWWTGIAAADLDGDGRMDLVAGNWGLNGLERATAAQPLRLYYGDFMQRNTLDLFETEYDGTSTEPMPARRWSEIAPHVPILAQRYGSHRAWAASPVRAVLGACPDVREVTASTLAATAFLNRGDRFELRPLPREAQWAPVSSVSVADFDADGREDIFLSQNFFAARSDYPRLDAGRGLLLRGIGQGDFAAMTAGESGLLIYGEQRGSATGDFDEDGRADLVVAQNGSATRLYRNKGGKAGLRVHLTGAGANPRAVGATLRLVAGGQVGALREIQAGSGWLSQNSATLAMSRPVPNQASYELMIRWPGGTETRASIPSSASSVFAEQSGKVSWR